MVKKRYYSRGTPIERAMERIILDQNDCWLWGGSLTSQGYGHIYLSKGKYAISHRVTYEHFRGEVPEGLELDHLCRVRACVNPWHLEAVTHRENALRGASEMIALHHAGRCKRGHALVDAHRDSHGRVRNCRTCRKEMRKAGRWT